MDNTIAEVIARLPVLPGQPYRTRVNGQEIEIRVVSPDSVPEEVPTGDLWLDVPRSPAARTLTVTRGPRQFPPPVQLTDADLSPA
jgi:hypothetical protein